MASPRRGGRPPILDHDGIVGAAIAVIDAEGLEALTMRRLGAELGVAAMSLYRHFENRESVLAAVVNRLAAEGMPALEETGSWPQAVRQFAATYRSMLLAHPNAVPLMATQPVGIETGMALLEGVIGRFTVAHIPPIQAVTIIQSVGVFTLGHALAQVGRPPGSPAESEPEQEPEPETAAFPGYYDAWFAAGLDALIAGFAASL